MTHYRNDDPPDEPEDYEDYHEDTGYPYGIYDNEFQDPGGRSALRAATPENPRIYPCPDCGRPNTLTAKDVALHYRCNHCADVAEGYYPSEY